jgi:hypothetical protein
VSVKKKNAAQLHWPACEGELKCLVDNTVDNRGLIIAASSAFEKIRSREDAALTASGVTLGPQGSVKFVYLADATSAIGQWRGKLLCPPDRVNHLSAAIIRHAGWAESVAMMIYVPHAVRWESGETICLVHMLSHMTDALRQRQLKQRGVTMLKDGNSSSDPDSNSDADEPVAPEPAAPSLTVAPTLRSFHASPRTYHPHTLPDGVEMAPLDVQPEDVTEIVTKLTQDSTTIHDVSVADLYLYLLHYDTPRSQPSLSLNSVKVIKAWAGKRFWVLTHPTHAAPLLYTQASLQKMHYLGEDVASCPTSIVVPVIPRHATVRVTKLASTVALQDDPAMWAEHDLRHDLLILTHQLQHHASATVMLRQLERLAYWPSMWQDVTNHVHGCKACIACTKTMAPGIGTRVAYGQRFTHWGFDHKILPKEVSEHADCDYVAILAGVDLADGVVVATPVRKLDAAHTCRAILSMLLPVYGVPQQLVFDPAPDLAGECMKYFADVLGVDDVRIVAPDQHVKRAENLFIDLVKQIDICMERNNLRNNADVELCTALWQHKKNCLDVSHGTTRSERATGSPPLTVVNAKGLRATLPPPTDATSKAFCGTLRQHTGALREEHLAFTAHRARSMALTKDIELARSRKVVDDVRISDYVGYQGKVYQVRDLHGPTSDTPIRALLHRTVQGTGKVDERSVLVQHLAPLSHRSPDVDFPTNTIVPQVGDFAIIEAGHELCGGEVTAVADTTVDIHRHDPSSTYSHWQPLYSCPNSDGAYVRAKAPGPAGHNALIESYKITQVRASGARGSNGKLDAVLTQALRDSSVIDSLPQGVTTHTSQGLVASSIGCASCCNSTAPGLPPLSFGCRRYVAAMAITGDSHQSTTGGLSGGL